MNFNFFIGLPQEITSKAEQCIHTHPCFALTSVYDKHMCMTMHNVTLKRCWALSSFTSSFIGFSAAAFNNVYINRISCVVSL